MVLNCQEILNGRFVLAGNVECWILYLQEKIRGNFVLVVDVEGWF